MSTIIYIDGGIGRVINSIPALLKYHKNHPDDEWYVMIPQFNYVMWGIPELQERTFNSDDLSSYDIFLKASKVITAEPYRVPEYYRNEVSLRESFDICINESKNHDDLPPLQLNLSTFERLKAWEVIEKCKSIHKKRKTIVLQPYGASARPHSIGVFDESNRSIHKNMLDFYVDNLSEKYNIIYMGAKEFYNPKTFRPNPDIHMREWMAVIDMADYFVGCDSCGQHMRKAFNKKASVVLGGTHRINTCHDDFHIIEKDSPVYPDAMRICSQRSHMSYRLNEKRLQFTSQEIQESFEQIVKNIENVK